MFGKKSMLSKIIKIFIYGSVNLVLVLGLINITKFNSQAPIQSQLLQILIIVAVTGFVDYIIINKKF
ncbi:MAG: hypothetical protein SCJ93_12750 [Bacillota bacterium]|nr:hypothetical protein [Bacillota bacterium]